ncbi:DAK2 domain-containing protein [Dermatobacter hominis]|uniref:DAK2 domain-containing protein n=1 Tax=Dermatobacter hominis TaxID=2884263 RepID=UPI001D112AFD|nr:DAK2 domain-containing protein [Dermatobacter hominis]UDY36899.1 DAK2 domain-containing protein [Dermatobacter hominis]
MAGSALRTTTPESMAPAEFLGAMRACATVLDQHAEALDRLDVTFDWDAELLDGADGRDLDGLGDDRTPGPGTDLATTLLGGCEAAGDGRDLSTVCRGLADGATRSARTAAGHRLAGFLAGAGDALRNADRVDGARLALALEAGAERVTEADDGTHPGCLLAVMSAAADGALDASDGGGDLSEVLVSAAEAGLVELEQGPLVDARLSERGTVDAAAAGFLLVLDSLAAVVAGDPLPEPPPDQVAPPVDVVGQRFVVRCRVTPPVPDIEAAADLEVVVHELSDRLVFEVAADRWTVDAVTALPGAVVEALAGAGRLSELHIGVASTGP